MALTVAFYTKPLLLHRLLDVVSLTELAVKNKMCYEEGCNQEEGVCHLFLLSLSYLGLVCNPSKDYR